MSRVHSLETLAARKVVKSTKPIDKGKIPSSALRTLREAKKDYDLDQRELAYEIEALQEMRQRMTDARARLKEMMRREHLTRAQADDVMSLKRTIPVLTEDIKERTSFIAKLKKKLY